MEKKKKIYIYKTESLCWNKHNIVNNYTSIKKKKAKPSS